MILLEAQTPSTGTVVGLGIGTVFFGLICLIAICYLLGFIMTRVNKGKADKEPATANTTPAVSAPANEPIVNRQELIAAVSAVIAEELGQDVEAIRIKSIKKL
ncbi:MAG: OadG family protein [Oscillospiraceae bacterium]|nr:OadG family protein [Ruminococcus sp.]MCD8344434.1 OadG family protein [Oscillospiraceae bacterium]